MSLILGLNGWFQIPTGGSLTAPPFSLHGDPDTGIFSSAANTLEITAGGKVCAQFQSGNATLYGNGTPLLYILTGAVQSTVRFDMYAGGRLVETSTPAAVADSAILYADDSAGKTRLMVRFPTGAAQQLAIEV